MSFFGGGGRIPGITTIEAILTALQTITEVSPTKKVLAKWKLSGLDPTEINTHRGVQVPIECITAAMKSSAGSNTATLDFETSNNDVSYNTLTGFTVNTVVTTGFVGKMSSSTTNRERFNEVGFLNGYIRLVAYNSQASQSMDIKNIKAAAVLILPAGVTIQKVVL